MAVPASGLPADGHVFDHSLRLAEAGHGRFRGELDRRWWVISGPNGGFLSSLCLHALRQVVGTDRHPRTLSLHFPARATEGPVEVEVRIEKEGRTFTFASGRMWQEDKLLIAFLGAFADAREATAFDDVSVPEVRPPEELEAPAIPDEMIPDFSRNFDYRPVSEMNLFSGADRAEATGWIRFAAERPVDDLMIATTMDAFYPAIFTKLTSLADVATIDLTIHFRATLPLPYDWLLGRFTTRRLTEGFCEEDGEVWSRDKTLLAQSRQLAVVRPL
ncbi:MAG TPA: thioesterase family protein [Actinomycetota bacterium]|nr:thioesterase family protein [Actinomycetota bacterium]